MTQSSRPDGVEVTSQATSEATPLPVATQEILRRLNCAAAFVEHPQTGELCAMMTFALPPLVPGGGQFLEQLAKWAVTRGVAAVATGRVLVVPAELFDLARAGLTKATSGDEPPADWLEQAFLNPGRLLGVIGDEARDAARQMFDAAIGDEVVDELRKALVELDEISAVTDSGRPLELTDIQRRITAALVQLDGPPLSPAALEDERLAIGTGGDELAFAPWPPLRMNFVHMADHAIQERDLRDLRGDGVETASEHVRNALMMLGVLELEAPADRMKVRSIGRLLVDALVAIEPRRV